MDKVEKWYIFVGNSDPKCCNCYLLKYMVPGFTGQDEKATHDTKSFLPVLEGKLCAQSSLTKENTTYCLNCKVPVETNNSQGTKKMICSVMYVF